MPTEVDDTHAGEVVSVTATPGRLDFYRVEYLWRGVAVPATFSFEKIALVTADDLAVTVGELFDWLAKSPGATVKLSPCAERLGLSIATEFRSPRSI